MALGQSIRNAIGTAWGGILSAVGAGQSAFQTVAQAVGIIGENIAPPSLLDTAVVGQLASLAGSWVAARDTLTAADDADTIDSSMITLAPWSADLNAFNANPNYHVVLGINVEGVEGTQYRTVTGISQLPTTVGELRQTSLINATAMSIGTTPNGGLGGTVTGLDSITITVGPAGG
jgi:hypothetical protein